jgi:hypothetical protein
MPQPPGYQAGERAWWWKIAMHLDEAQRASFNVLAHNVEDPTPVHLLQGKLREMQAFLLEIFRWKGLLPGVSPAAAAVGVSQAAAAAVLAPLVVEDVAAVQVSDDVVAVQVSDDGWILDDATAAAALAVEVPVATSPAVEDVPSSEVSDEG